MTTRLSYTLGLMGPTVCHDTACSSSLMAMGFAHWKLRAEQAPMLHSALVMGVNLHMTPARYIFLGSGGFLTRQGRCFTFDKSAEGYCRGEGCGGTLVQRAGAEADQMLRCACVAGTALNQDGRSASLTAPNGPSQQAVIRMSMRMAAVTPEMTGAAECHGTGTSLGDPIEVGALVSVLGPRSWPLLFTTHKTNMGHPEANAGMAGIAKCVLMVQNSLGIANVHLRSLSPHLNMDGFPHYAGLEITDPRRNSQVLGVSSFGFGGSNARADFWGRSTNGQERLAEACDFAEVICPRCQGPMCWLCGVAIPQGAGGSRHRCSLIREELDGYGHCSNCYQGQYSFGRLLEDARNPGQRVYIVGTWSAWSQLHEMEETESGTYTFVAALGETLCEQFYLVLDGDSQQAIYPAAAKAGPYARVLGPDKGRSGRSWLLDGRGGAGRPGAAFSIVFEWGERRRLSWEALPAADEEEAPERAAAFSHAYYLTGSWAAWQLQAMQPGGEEGLHEASFRLGFSRQEEFQILRDRDPAQAIHPAEARATDPSVPLRGPDDLGAGKHWLVRGREGEVVRVRLQVRAGSLSVTLVSATLGIRTFEGGGRPCAYHIAGTFSEWQCCEMEPCEGKAEAYSYVLCLGSWGREEFQILLDADWSQALYPALPEAGSGEALLQGPDDGGLGQNWAVSGQPGALFEVVLDLSQADRRRMVQWAPLEGGE